MSDEKAEGTVFYETFEFKDKEVKIKQDTLKGHAAILWDAARVLAKYLEVHPADWNGKRVLDLGSGCGLTAICLGVLGAKVTMTELPNCTDVLQENAAANLAAGGAWDVRECVWGKPGEVTSWGQVADLGQEWDYVVGSDLIYSDDSTPHLIETLVSCMSESCEFIMSMELRRARDKDFFTNLQKRGFSFRKIPSEEQHPVYQAEEIGVFSIRKKPPHEQPLGALEQIQE